jgi:geranylgeranyl diphosphate synthase type I
MDELADRIEKELAAFADGLDKPPYDALPPACRDAVRTFVLRPGKRLRPWLFLVSYAGYAPPTVPGLERSAIALELLHDFILIHDDLIDRSATRRAGPALHVLLREALRGRARPRFTGEDMAMVAGDLLYAAGLRLFLEADVPAGRKTRALAYLTQAAVFTACGELKELADTLEPMAGATAEGLSRTSEWKTAYYTYACPIVTGAMMAGAGKADVERLTQYALAVGLAFQIRDDIEDLGDGNGGGAALDDLREGKRTLPLWYACHHGTPEDRAWLAAWLAAGTGVEGDLARAREIIVRSGGLDFAWREVARHAAAGRDLLDALAMRPDSLERLRRHAAGLLPA